MIGRAAWVLAPELVRLSDQPRRSATAAQWHTARPSGLGVSESGTPLSAPSSVPPVAQVRSSVNAPRGHTPCTTQTSDALHPAYGTSPSLECDLGHTSSPPPYGPYYGPVRGYGLSPKRCDSSPVDPVYFFSDSDHFEDDAAPDNRSIDASVWSESIQDALAHLALFSGAVKTVSSTSGNFTF